MKVLENLAAEQAAFLSRCQASSQDAFDAFKDLLSQLRSKEQTADAIRFLNGLFDLYESTADQQSFQSQYHFSFHKVEIGSENNIIRLLQLPSIFTPEEWSYTFYEGLSRFPASYFSDKIMAELGCGNGWITISLAKHSSLKKIYGLDINPRAIYCAWINLYFNAYDRQGKLDSDPIRGSLLDRVEFAESDLLAYCFDKQIMLDRVIGCIPQVLSPNPEVIIKSVAQMTSDQELYDLSNYCGMQGYVEDQFGLGLVARALEESVRCLRTNGSIVLNLGGRPGVGVLERLFRRRGLQVKRIWSTRVPQAADTDIGPLVEIEENSQHRFEFYMGIEAKEPIDARTAQAYVNAGGSITHALTVYEAVIPNHEEIKNILSFLQAAEFEEVRAAIDLYSDNPAIYEERVRFLSALAKKLAQSSQLPYEATQGKAQLRKRIADFIFSYFHAPITEEQILVAPSRHDVLANFLSLYHPQLALIDKTLCQEMDQEWLNSHQKVSKTKILEAPRRGELVRELIQTLHPQFVVTALNAYENESTDSFAALVDCCQKHNCRLLVDISDFFDLSSSPQTNAALTFMARHSLPLHVSLVCGLVKNIVYSDLDICFVITENRQIMDHLIAAAEFTYSRTPLLSQEYYETILEDLLSFQLFQGKAQLIERKKQEDTKPEDNILAKAAETALNHPCIKRSSKPITHETIRLDYGENCFAIPNSLKVGIFESFARKDISPAEAAPDSEILDFFAKSLGLGRTKEHYLVYGCGIAPLFSGLMVDCAQKNGTVIFPTGCYGEFVATAQFFGTSYHIHPTLAKDHFKFTPSSLHQALDGRPESLVFLNSPIVNPTGTIYSKSEIVELCQVIQAHRARLILDMAFLGLEFEAEKEWLKNLPDENLEWVILGSASKQLAAGGLRFGFGLTNSAVLHRALLTGVTKKPHFTVLYAMKKLYQQLNHSHPELIAALSEQRLLLKKRAERLTSTLTNLGWEPLPSSGGLFLVAKPSSYLGKSLQLNQQTIVIDSKNIADILMETTNLLINGSEWTGIPDYCRFVLSVSDEDFEKGLAALHQFAKLFSN